MSGSRSARCDRSRGHGVGESESHRFGVHSPLPLGQRTAARPQRSLYTAPPSRFLPNRGAGDRAAVQAFSGMLPFVREPLRSEPPK